MDMFRALPALRDELEDIDQRVRSRMARVVASDGHMVTVELPRPGGWDGPLGPYPSTVSSLPPGSTGYLEPLRGNQYLFVAVGMGLVVPFGGTLTGTITNSAGGTAYVDYLTIPLTLAAGTYTIMGTASGTLGKSVANGTIYLRMHLGPTDAYTGMNQNTLAINSRTQLALHHQATITLASAETITARLAFTHDGAAGTTTMYQGALSGWYQRIR